MYYWFEITGEAPADSQVVEITGAQFKWEYRYPGKDGKFGRKYYKEINELQGNPLGQIWEDPNNHDDIYVSGTPMHIVVNKPIKLIINAKDVIHDVGLPHFRMKMDAVPGTPTTMWFTPKYTTRQMKEKYGDNFEYEIACDQMCGSGHYTMRGIIIVETQAEFDQWMAQQTPLYASSAKGNSPAPISAPDTTGNGAAGTTMNR